MKTYRQMCVIMMLCAAGCGGGGSSSATPSMGGPPQFAPTPTSTPTPMASPAPTPPASQAQKYALMQTDLNNYTAAVNAQCPANPTAATRFDVELLQSNANFLVSQLPGKSIAQAQAIAANAVANAVAIHTALPGIGFMLNPNYPVLVQNQANAPTWWSTSANYPVFAAYYTALAQGLTQNGITYDTEANLVFPSYSGQNYSGVSIAQLEAGVAEDASNILTVMAPQNMNIASEPLTLSQNTGQSSFNTPSGYAGYAAAVRSAIVVPQGSTTKIGGGSADWSSTAFLTAIEGVPNLAFIDEHLYPPDVLTTAGGGIAQVDAINPSVTGKPGIITETWDEKDAGDAGSFGAANAPQLEQLNTYSFWAPLDAQYITSTMKLARCENLAVVGFWYQYELFAYLDYATGSTMTPTQAQGAIGNAANQAAAAGTLSSAGAALFMGLTGRVPASSSKAHSIRRP